MDEALFEYDSVSICNNGQGLKILDQTKLPNEEVFIILQNEDDFTDAIKKAIEVSYAKFDETIDLTLKKRETDIRLKKEISKHYLGKK